MDQLFSIAFALFLLMDPIGNVPIFISILKDVETNRLRKIILREMLIALGIIVTFNFLGEFLLDFLRVDRSTLLISGGLILFIIAIRMVFPEKAPAARSLLPFKEPFIVPLAVPLVAGPAVLAAVMLYSYQNENPWTSVGAICLAWIASTLILLSATRLRKLLGDRGLIACERLMGLLLILLSVQMFLEGMQLFLGAVARA